MPPRKRPSTAFTSASTSYPVRSHQHNTTTISRSRAARRSGARPDTARPTTAATSIARVDGQHIICAVTESRGISPTVGLAFVNLDNAQAVLCQICDSQTYVHTIHKLLSYAPAEILVVSSAASSSSKLFSIIDDNLASAGCRITAVDRGYFSESAGSNYIQQLAFADDVEAINLSLEGKYFCVCCFAAVLKHIQLMLCITLAPHSLRIRYEPSEGSMMVDISTVRALELIQNLENPKSRDCLFGLLNETLTPMGARLLRSNILQPLTNKRTLNTRYDALEEMSTREDTFFATRQALTPIQDVDKVLTALIVIRAKPSVQIMEQAINQVIRLKQFVNSVRPIYEALTGARSTMLNEIRKLCHPDNIDHVQELIDSIINEDTMFASRPLELRNQHTYAVKAGVNGLLDVARQAYKEATEDAYQHVVELEGTHDLRLTMKFDNSRQFYIQIPVSDLEDRPLPPVFTNVLKNKKVIECQTLDLMKRNQKIVDAHNEVVCLSNKAIQDLIAEVRHHMGPLFKICESIGLLDMIASFAHLVTSQEYTRPKLTDTLAIKSGRHPIRERLQPTKFMPNDFYATQQRRFQIITGCNMSGKSTYIRSVALMSVMAQIGMFVPAQYASLPIKHQLFARLSLDDSIEANVSTFAAEMREAAFILHNINKHSIAIIDELGRGTSTRDGLAIALAISEALVDSHALVWFATHFRDLATIMAERNGVVNLHLAVDIRDGGKSMNMLYRIAEGPVREQHYGLALARVVPLPQEVLERADQVSVKLEQSLQKAKKTSAAVIRERRRKLILNLKEHLLQAQSGAMEGEVLSRWLKELQREFVVRMSAIDTEVAESEQSWGSDSDSGAASKDMLMHSEIERGGARPESAITISSRPSSSTTASRVETRGTLEDSHTND